MSDVEKVARAIARRIAKREYGEQYEGYESTHKEAADDYARTALSAARPDEWSAAIEAAAKAQCPDCAAGVKLTKDGNYHLVAGEFGDDASVKRWCSSARIHALRRAAGEEG